MNKRAETRTRISVVPVASQKFIITIIFLRHRVRYGPGPGVSGSAKKNEMK